MFAKLRSRNRRCSYPSKFIFLEILLEKTACIISPSSIYLFISLTFAINSVLDIFSELEDKEISKIKLAWGSLYNKSKQEYEKFIEENPRLEIESYNKTRDKLVLKKIIE